MEQKNFKNSKFFKITFKAQNQAVSKWIYILKPLLPHTCLIKETNYNLDLSFHRNNTIVMRFKK
jgi:hypothetical protein